MDLHRFFSFRKRRAYFDSDPARSERVGKRVNTWETNVRRRKVADISIVILKRAVWYVEIH